MDRKEAAADFIAESVNSCPAGENCERRRFILESENWEPFAKKRHMMRKEAAADPTEPLRPRPLLWCRPRNELGSSPSQCASLGNSWRDKINRCVNFSTLD